MTTVFDRVTFTHMTTPQPTQTMSVRCDRHPGHEVILDLTGIRRHVGNGWPVCEAEDATDIGCDYSDSSPCGRCEPCRRYFDAVAAFGSSFGAAIESDR